MNREELWLLKEKYNGEKTCVFYAECERLHAGVPLAYLIGHIPFLNTTIYLDSKPLIPRPETEFWVEKAIAEIQQHIISRFDLDKKISRSNLDMGKVRVLDLCAGSGCIGVAALKAIPEATVDFIEIDEAHIPTIKKNCEENGIDSSKYTIIQSDLFSSRSDLELKYDFILTNPPYIDASLLHTDASVTEHEPHLALFGGEHGLELISKILKEATSFLTKEGVLYLEHETEHKEPLQNLAIEYGLHIVTHTDQYGVPRYSRITVAQ